MKNKKRAGVLIIVILFILANLLYYQEWRSKEIENDKFYSLIFYQNTDNEWVTMLEGIHQAEDDRKVKVHEVMINKEGQLADQVEAIEKELDAGTSGLLIAAVDSNGLAEYLQKKKINVPIVFLETGATEKYPAITADNYEMGELLGKELLKDMDKDSSEKIVTIVNEFQERDSVQERYNGLIDTLEKSKHKIEIQNISRDKGDFSLRLLIETSLSSRRHYIAALDKFCTVEAAAAYETLQTTYETENSHIYIYGIGNTGQTINDLDNERIRTLVFQNEFKIGYEGLSVLLGKEKEKLPDISYKMVTKESLYDTENERLLFTSD